MRTSASACGIPDVACSRKLEKQGARSFATAAGPAGRSMLMTAVKLMGIATGGAAIIGVVRQLLRLL
jgi:hypothetical protein